MPIMLRIEATCTNTQQKRYLSSILVFFYIDDVTPDAWVGPDLNKGFSLRVQGAFTSTIYLSLETYLGAPITQLEYRNLQGSCT